MCMRDRSKSQLVDTKGADDKLDIDRYKTIIAKGTFFNTFIYFPLLLAKKIQFRKLFSELF